MFDLIRPGFEFGSWYVQKLLADIPEENMAAQPVAGVTMNHAAWTVGHIAWANDNALHFLDKTCELASWKQLVGMGSVPSSDRTQYPSKADLIRALQSADKRLWDAATAAPDELLNQPSPEDIRKMFPIRASLIAGLMTGHYASHIGQLSAWRRAMGFKPVW